MKIKRILAGFLASAVLCSLMAVIPASAAKLSAFGDITDANTAEAAETLRLLGVVDGDGNGNFNPYSLLTRAQFCKMAVEIMGNGDKVMAQMNRTVFADVPSTHWARGYVAVATQGATVSGGEDKPSTTTPGIIRGDATGLFHPDQTITYAEAVTILMRILGYQDAELGIGGTWYDGYLSTAKSIKLTDGVNLNANDNITRGQAAVLFDNLLFTKKNKSDTMYLKDLGCTITDETVIFAVDATAPDGSLNAVKTLGDKVYKTNHTPFSDDLVGRRAKLVLDKNEKVIATQLSETGTQRVVSILSANYNTLKLSDGTEVKIEEPTKAKVYQNGSETTYDKAYINLAAGTQAVLQYSASGELEYMFLRSTAKTDSSTTVLKNKPTPPVTEPSYKIYKNGVLATTKDYRQYDVTTYDSANNVMYVSDLRVTGVYENVTPNPQTPAKVTIMQHEFDVLPSAYADLTSFKPGDSITLLLSYNGQVAGAVSPSVVKSTTVGQVESIKGGEAVVVALNLRDSSGQPMKFSGTTSYTGTSAESMIGQLVTISSSAKGRINLSKLSGSGATSSLNVSTGKIGTASLSANVKIYEKVGTSVIGQDEVELKDITVVSVPASKIPYVHKDYAGNIDIMVLDDVTGDQYDYGFLNYTAPVVDPGSPNDPMTGSTKPATVSITNAEGKTDELSTASTFRTGSLYGIVKSVDKTVDGTDKLAAYIELQAIKGVSSSAFDTENMTLTTTSAVYPIASNVQCYNRDTNTWFKVDAKDEDSFITALNQARAYSSTVTIYVDKAPEDGGKVRLVVIE